MDLWPSRWLVAFLEPSQVSRIGFNPLDCAIASGFLPFLRDWNIGPVDILKSPGQCLNNALGQLVTISARNYMSVFLTLQ